MSRPKSWFSFLQLKHGLARKRAMFENVHIDWRISSHENDGSTDFSEDELDDINGYHNHMNNNNVTRTPDRFQRKKQFDEVGKKVQFVTVLIGEAASGGQFGN